MKWIIILYVMLLPSVLYSQVVNHFVNPDSKWNVANTYPAGNLQNPSFVATTTIVYGFKGDTIINGEQWLKIYSTNDSSFQNNLIYEGLIREDNNKVFYINSSNQLDTLYDFSLNIGDTVLYNLYGMYPIWLKVINVDSIQINGNYYKRLKFSEPIITAFDVLNEIWIEGIGSIHGPLFPNNPVKFSQEIPDSMFVTCTYSNNQQVWLNPSYPKCYIKNVLGVDNIELSKFKIYPNPFNDIIHIENSKLQLYYLTITNSIGQTIKHVQVKNAYQIIDLKELKAGIYFLRIGNQQNTTILKIIKKY